VGDIKHLSVRNPQPETRSAHAIRVYFDRSNRRLCAQCPLARIQARQSTATGRFNGRFSFFGARRRDKIFYPYHLKFELQIQFGTLRQG
jgi:hypothetical protein